jgi:hypothetical protein
MNEELFADLGNDVMPLIDLFGEKSMDDANNGDATQLQANADRYTPEAINKYLSAQIVID